MAKYDNGGGDHVFVFFTLDGKTFRPSDWSERLAGAMSCFRPGAVKGNLGAYTTADFSVGVKNDVWAVEVFATNLFDERGVVNTGVQCLETVCGTGVTPTTPTGGAFYDTVIKPRIIGLKISRDF